MNTRISRAKLVDGAFVDHEIIYAANPLTPNPWHLDLGCYLERTTNFSLVSEKEEKRKYIQR